MPHRIVSALLASLVMLLSGGVIAPVTVATATGAAIDPPALLLSGDEEHLLAWVNLMRAHASREALVVQPVVQQFARERSEDMARRDYFGHTTPEGEMVLARLPAYGVRYSYAGETLQRNNYPAMETVRVAIDSLMDSPAHREILLDPSFTHIGIGHAVAGETHYFTVIVLRL